MRFCNCEHSTQCTPTKFKGAVGSLNGQLTWPSPGEQYLAEVTQWQLCIQTDDRLHCEYSNRYATTARISFSKVDVGVFWLHNHRYLYKQEQ